MHFKFDTPQAERWAYEHGISLFEVRDRIRRYVGLGGLPPVYVVVDEDAVREVSGRPAALGYTYSIRFNGAIVVRGRSESPR